MIFDVLSLFPEMIENYCSYSIIKRAVQAGIITVNALNPRDFTLDKHKKVDDTPYGGGAGIPLCCLAVHFAAARAVSTGIGFL